MSYRTLEDIPSDELASSDARADLAFWASALTQPSVSFGEQRAHLVGEIDQSCVDVLRAGFARLVEDEAAGSIVVDCADLGFIDLSGLRVLLTVARECERRNRSFVVVNLPPYFARLVSRLRLENQLHLVGAGAGPGE